METRVALIGIIIEDTKQAGTINELLSTYGKYIIGRMGLPYKAKGINIISVIIDAPQDAISTLSGKIGKRSRFRYFEKSRIECWEFKNS